jgi:integrase
MLLESGEELSTVSKLARHSSFSITADIYGHLTTNMQNQAAEKIDAILKIK